MTEGPVESKQASTLVSMLEVNSKIAFVALSTPWYISVFSPLAAFLPILVIGGVLLLLLNFVGSWIQSLYGMANHLTHRFHDIQYWQCSHQTL